MHARSRVPPGGRGLRGQLRRRGGAMGMGSWSLALPLLAIMATIVSPGAEAAAVLTLVVQTPDATFEPGGLATLHVVVDNTGNQSSLATWVNMTFPQNFSWSSDSAGSAVRSAGPGFFSLRLPGLAAGGSYDLLVNLSSSASVVGRTSHRIDTVLEYIDASGSPASGGSVTTLVTARAPSFTLTKVADRTAGIHGGETLNYTIYFNNTANANAAFLWINDTLDPGLTFLEFSGGPAGSRLVVGSRLQWTFTSIGPGERYSVTYKVRASPTYPDTYRIYNLAFAEYTDSQGHPLRPGVASGLTASAVEAPTVSLRVGSSRSSAAPRDQVVLTLTVANNGSAMARQAWVNLTLDPYLTHLSDDFPIPHILQGSTLAWRLQDLRSAETRSYSLVVQVRPGTPYGSTLSTNSHVAFTNPDNLGWRVSRARAVATEVSTPLVGFLTQPPALGIYASAAAGGLLIHYLLFRPRVREAFLVHRGGILLSHFSRSGDQGMDQDIITGMLTAVQTVLKQGFTYGEAGELRNMDLGKYKGIIERSAHLYLAIMYAGHRGNSLVPKMRRILKEEESIYGSNLEGWQGDMTQLPGIGETLERLLRSPLSRDSPR